MKLVFSKGLSYLYVGIGNFRSALVELFSWRPSLIYGSIAILLNLLAWIFAIIIHRSIGEELAILHYNITFGIDRIGDVRNLYLLPLSGLAIIIANLLLASLITKKEDRILIHILLSMCILGNGIVLLGLYAAYVVNFS